jgi:hypothetical protein
MIFIVVHFDDFDFGIVRGELFEGGFHICEDTVIEDSPAILGTENEMIDTVIDAVGLFLEDLLHRARLPFSRTGGRRIDFIPLLTQGVLRRCHKPPLLFLRI